MRASDPSAQRRYQYATDWYWPSVRMRLAREMRVAGWPGIEHLMLCCSLRLAEGGGRGGGEAGGGQVVRRISPGNLT